MTKNVHVVNAPRGRVGDHDIDPLAPPEGRPQTPEMGFHLFFVILVRTAVVPHRPFQAYKPHAPEGDDPAMQIRASARWILVKPDIMIAFDKKQGHIENMGQVAQIFGRQVAARHDQIDSAEGVAVGRVQAVFMLLMALAVAVGMKIVGILLITSLLIIPAATARVFAAAGTNVALAARNGDAIAELAGEIGPRAIAIPCDVSRYWEVEAAVAACHTAFGRLDVLIGNAGVIAVLALMGLAGALLGTSLPETQDD